MTLEQGALSVIGTLGTVISVLFGLVLSSHKARIAGLLNELKDLKNQLDDCREDRDKIWAVLREMPNPRFCTVKGCILRNQTTPGPLHVLFDEHNPITENRNAE